MVLYFKNYFDKNIAHAKVVKETKCFYFLDRNGIDYSKRIYKDDVGKHYFESFNEAVDNEIKRAEYSLQHAKDRVVKEKLLLEDIKRWAFAQKNKESCSTTANILNL
jgi:hypothetical protein